MSPIDLSVRSPYLPACLIVTVSVNYVEHVLNLQDKGLEPDNSRRHLMSLQWLCWQTGQETMPAPSLPVLFLLWEIVC